MPLKLSTTSALLVATLSAGCEGEVGFRGYDMYDYFPLDGSQRQWAYQNEDPDQDWTLLVDKQGSEAGEDLEIVTLEYSHAETGDVLFQLFWSSDALHGVLLHGYQDVEADGDEVRFSQPVTIASYRMAPGDSVTTTVDDHIVTATLHHMQVGCETTWAPSWSDHTCLNLRVTDSGKAARESTLFTGSYWLVFQYGVAWMELDHYQGMWNLSSAGWQE